MLTRYYIKRKKLSKKACAMLMQIFLKKKKTKGANILLNNIEIFLKEKKKRILNMVVSDIQIF